MVILGGWVFYVVEEKICVVKAIYEYECIRWKFGIIMVCSITIKSAYNYAIKTLVYPGR